MKDLLKGRIGVNLREISTWQGLLGFITMAGVQAMPPQHMTWFLPLMGAIVCAVSFFVKDLKPKAEDVEAVAGEARRIEEKTTHEDLADLVRRNQS